MPAADEFDALPLGSCRRVCFGSGARGCGSTVSASSLKACAFMRGVDPVFLRCGFVMGDFPTFVLALPLAAVLFLVFFAAPAVPAVLDGGNAGMFASKSMPSGELVEVAESPRSNITIGSD